MKQSHGLASKKKVKPVINFFVFLGYVFFLVAGVIDAFEGYKSHL